MAPSIPQVLRNTDERDFAHLMSDFKDSAFGHTLWRVQNKWVKFSHWELVFCFVFVIIERNLRWKIILLKWHGALGLAASHSDVMKALSPTKWRSSIHFIPTIQPLFSLPAWWAALENQVWLLTTYFLKECPLIEVKRCLMASLYPRSTYHWARKGQTYKVIFMKWN